ncbi:MAG TPA: hypothetical protein VJA46_01335 [Acidimicrobiia bacterium]|nr:hypothetical protein [Acidimicrobiia bacterium]
MRFTGQVRVPEVDHPGVPATFVVEGDQAEVLLDGESLGRWSLFDVHASRLVSAAFSVSLAGDEITFIADEPVDFAYKGVDHMAESWARYKAMTLPRRMVAVGRSRRGTLPSRVIELRDAMLANLEIQSIADRAQEAEELETAQAAEASAATSYLAPPAPTAPPVEASPPPIFDFEETIRTPVEQVEPAPPVIEDEVVPSERPLPMRPGPGLVARPPTPIPAPPVPEVDPVDIFQPEPVELAPVELAPVEPEAVEAIGPEPVETEAVEAIGPEPVEMEPVETIRPEPVETMEPAALIEPKPVPEVPALVKELLDRSGDDDRDEKPKRLVVDLGAYEVPRAPDPEPMTATPQNRVPALAAAAPVPDRSGIFGAVRAAFVRSKGSHDHEFVEAPGGIGITRHICSECGYISIGVSETDSD